ncbi:MAG: fumarylacetoacetate hydrolase family protein [Actinobacteria bacterium]|nr:fumarylacetoacetate hydrolase family protein [Actinomycetota bacterium]
MVPPNFLAIGLNYRAHVAEGGRTDPERPVVFNKQISCITGPNHAIHIPAEAPDLVDYEGELGVVIGKTCRRVPADRAHEVIAGYLVVNDVSVRDWQKASPTMTMGKSWDTHGPIGPWLVSADEIADPGDLDLTTTVDGEIRQQTNTSEMIFNISALIAHLSTAFTLLAGTVIATGTPEGVGFYRSPRTMLQAGQTVEVSIEGIGKLSNPVIDDPNPGVVIS